MEKATEIRLSKIAIDPDLQARASIDDETVSDYAAIYNGPKAGDMPPIVLFDDGKKLWLSDGHQRVSAKRQNKQKTIKAVIRKGSRKDALLFGIAKNITQGKRFTMEDKRRAATLLFKNFPDVPNNWVAERCDIASATAGKIRADVYGDKTEQKVGVRTVRRGGKTFQMDVSNIGTGKKRSGTKESKKNYDTLPIDGRGKPVTEAARQVFDDREQFEAVSQQCDELIDSFKLLSKLPSGAGGKIELKASSQLIKDLKAHLSLTIPHRVCPKCTGKDEPAAANCSGCGGSGFLSKIDGR